MGALNLAVPGGGLVWLIKSARPLLSARGGTEIVRG